MPEKLIVVDAMAHIYQAFYAIRGLTAPDGRPVNAVYGFARMIESLRRDYAPDYLVVAFDMRVKLKRAEIYPEYKANRDPMPAELASQIDLIRELLSVQGVPVAQAAGYEADDVLGTVARVANEREIDAVVVTTDKDAEQLISEHTSVLHMGKKGAVMLDPAGLMEAKGVEPWQVVEVMSLSGDSVDNVPGAPGIGPKKATAFIKEFGTVEKLYENLDKVSGPKTRQNLAEHRADVDLAREMVQLDCNAPIELELEDARVGASDAAPLQAFYRALGFSSMLDKKPAAPRGGQGSLFGGPAEAPTLDSIKTVRTDYSAVTTLDGVAALVEKLRNLDALSVDLETTSLDPHVADIVGVALSWREGQGVYIATAGPPDDTVCPVDEALALLKPVLESETPAKLGQNLKYDMAVLRRYDIALRGLHCDSMVADYLLSPSRRGHGLDAMAVHHLNYETVKISELIGKGRKQTTMDRVPVARVAPYACEDADIALRLCRLLEPRLHEQGLWDLFTRIERPLVPVLMDMEWHGVAVDAELLTSMSAELATEMTGLVSAIHEEAGHEFNVNSPKQLSHVLFEEMHLHAAGAGKRTTGRSTSAKVLRQLAEHAVIAELVLRYRELAKLKSTYADALVALINPVTGRVHTSFKQTGTATGRLSSADPNLQNIPVRTELGRRIRAAFVAGEADMSLLSADYSQVELRVLAHCSGDPTLKQAFNEDRDIHRFVAAQVNGVTEEEVTSQMRQNAKGVNFGIIYGQGKYGLAGALGIPVREAEEFIDGYFHRYPQVKKFMRGVVRDARRDGHVHTLSGRRREIEGINGAGTARAAAERVAVNTVIQGSAADLIKVAMIDIHRELPGVCPRARMLMQIHDELVFEVPDCDLDTVSAFVAEKMTGALPLDVKLKVDIATGKNWAEAK